MALRRGANMTLTTVDAGMLNSQSQQTWRNRIINGAMVIDQRNAGASITANNTTFSVDRFKMLASVASKFTSQQNAGSVTPPTGFINYAGYTSSSAYSVGAAEVFAVQQNIEGLNIFDFEWGTASAQPITLSFWVRASLTGTYSVVFKNSAANRSYVASYTVSASNTWEQKTITIAGDTSGTWLTTSGIGLRLYFTLAAGSTQVGSAGSWQAADLYGVTGGISVVGTNGATFYITGVQLEKGSTATSFDYRDIGRELIMCQRYFETTYPVGYPSGYNFAQQYPFSTSKPVTVNLIASDDTVVSQSIRFAVVKRTSATIVIYSANDGASGFTWTYKGTGGTNLNLAASVTYTSENLWNIGQGLSAVNQANESYFHFTASAEL
jgi:hypothetical protein